MAEPTYTVKSGDSLSKIAKELWGDARRWPELFEANKDQLKDPNLIRVGQVLHIPGAQAEPAAAAPAPEPPPEAEAKAPEAPLAPEAVKEEEQGLRGKKWQQE